VDVLVPSLRSSRDLTNANLWNGIRGRLLAVWVWLERFGVNMALSAYLAELWCYDWLSTHQR